MALSRVSAFLEGAYRYISDGDCEVACLGLD